MVVAVCGRETEKRRLFVFFFSAKIKLISLVMLLLVCLVFFVETCETFAASYCFLIKNTSHLNLIYKVSENFKEKKES